MIKEDVSPACFARRVKAYYRKQYHVTPSFSHNRVETSSVGWRSLKKNSARLSTSDMFYIHCIDPNVKFEYSSRGEASLNLVTVLAHVSLPSDLSRGGCLFVSAKEIMDSLKVKRSPVVCRVKASGLFEVSKVLTLFLFQFLVLCGTKMTRKLLSLHKYARSCLTFWAFCINDLQPLSVF